MGLEIGEMGESLSCGHSLGHLDYGCRTCIDGLETQVERLGAELVEVKTENEKFRRGDGPVFPLKPGGPGLLTQKEYTEALVDRNVKLRDAVVDARHVLQVLGRPNVLTLAWQQDRDRVVARIDALDVKPGIGTDPVFLTEEDTKKLDCPFPPEKGYDQPGGEHD